MDDSLAQRVALDQTPKYNAGCRMRTQEHTPAWKRKLRHRLLAWFNTNKRDLPWRRDRDPYRVWLSEVMLQQTRVSAVIEHYNRFLQRFPTVERLASARESAVLAAWSGLGYYRRARMLHTAAKTIARELGGEFPATAEAWRELPGVGRYTAAAIASIAFDEPVAVVDGNVERVLERMAGQRLKRDQIWQAAEELISTTRPGDFNQAMMELGATVCLPRQPKCLLCPITNLCGTRGELPQQQKAAPQQKRDIHYALDCRNGSVFFVRRPKAASLMPGMWELPEISAGIGPAEPGLTLKHSITVTDYTVHVHRVSVPESVNAKLVLRSQLSTLPLTGLARKILRAAKLI